MKLLCFALIGIILLTGCNTVITTKSERASLNIKSCKFGCMNYELGMIGLMGKTNQSQYIESVFEIGDKCNEICFAMGLVSG